MAGALFPGRDLIRNFVVLGLWQDVAFDQITRIVVGTACDNAIGLSLSHGGQTQQLLFCGKVQIEWLIAAPALAYTCRHRLRIALHFRRCLRGFFFQLLRVLWLSAARERGQEQYRGNAPMSGEVHFDQPFRCLG